MKKLATFIALVACSIAGAEAAQNYTLNMGDFTELKIVDGLNVNYACNADSAGMVVFECDPAIAPAIMMQNKKGSLKIELQNDLVTGKSLPTLRVYSTFLSKAENSGDSTLIIDTPAPTAEIKLSLIGNGRLVARNLHATTVEGKNSAGHGRMSLTGEAQWAKLRTMGTGPIEAGDLKAQKGSLSMTGTGNVDCWVTDELSVTGLSKGKVYLKGQPTVKNRTLGSVKVILIDKEKKEEEKKRKREKGDKCF